MPEESPPYDFLQPPPHTTGHDVTLTYGPTVPPTGYEDTGDAQPPPHGTTDRGDRCAVCATLAARVVALERVGAPFAAIPLPPGADDQHFVVYAGLTLGDFRALRAALGVAEGRPDAECV